MNKSSLIIFLVLSLLGWLVFSAFYCKSSFCDSGVRTNAAIGATGAAGAAAAAALPASSCGTWSFADGSSFRAKANRHYQFKKSSATIIKPTDNTLVDAISKTVAYLKSNANRKLVITGLYDIDENNSTSSQDLGLARATNVKNALAAMGVNVNQMMMKSRTTSSNKFQNGTMCQGVEFNFTNN